MTEMSKQELLAQAESLEAEAVEHESRGRYTRGDDLREQADRLRRLADGAPVGPSPESVEAAAAEIRAKLDEGRSLIEQGVSVFASCEEAIVKLFLGSAAGPVGEAASAEIAAARAAQAEAVRQRDEALARVDELEAVAVAQAAEADANAAAVAKGEVEPPAVVEGSDGEGEGADAPTEFDIEKSVPELLEYVGDDVERAKAVLAAEIGTATVKGAEPRKTLVEPLQDTIDTAAGAGA